MLHFFTHLFDTSDFPPRWKCGHWSEGHGWLHILSDLGIWSAYVAIPCVLLYFAAERRDLPFRRIFLLFGAFILACGATHLMEAIIFWYPLYRLAGVIKLAAAAVSWATVVALVPIVPRALSLRSPRELEREIAERKRAEAALQEAKHELERRVDERTRELAAANANLQTQITERVRAEEGREALLESERAARSEAERMSRVKDEFLASLSHELRTPLNAILGWSQLMRSGKLAEPDMAQGLEVVERNSLLQAQLIDDLLDVSRIIAGKLRLDVQMVDLHQVVNAAIQTVSPAADAKNVRLQSVLDPGAGPVSGDPDRLQQVVWNLISNAVKFTPKGGKVRVELLRINSHIEISVSDTGEGIAPEVLPHVFQRFWQADGSSTRRNRGLGLGLSIVLQLVELHGGSVQARSPGLGRGSTFVVRLPMAIAHDSREDRLHPERASGLSSRQGSPSLSGLKILVVDDEADSRDVMRRLLTAAEAEVALAASADEALVALSSFKADALVSDIGMPVRDGYDLIQQARAEGLLMRDAPAIAVTAFARSEDRRRILLSGFQMHIAKPVEPVELIAAIASLMGRTGGALDRGA